MRTSLSSTAKCTAQRPNSNSRSRGSRSRLYCCDGVRDGLLGEAVLQLEGGDGQAVDEQAEVERAARLVHAVGELAGDRETILGVQRLGLEIARRRRTVEKVEVASGVVLDSLAQHVDDAALADLAGQTLEELQAVDVPGVIRVADRQPFERSRLGDAQEGEELRRVERMRAVVVAGAAGGVAAATVGRWPFGDAVRERGKTVRAGHVSHDQRFEAFLAGVGGHAA
jgi:hypothetical protein